MRKIIFFITSIICLTLLGFWIYNMTLYSEKIVEGVMLKDPKLDNDVITQVEIDSQTEIIDTKKKDIIEVEEECIFDVKTQTDDFIKKIPEFANYKWNDKNKQANVKLDNGNELILTRGGCDHFTLSGNLILKNEKIDISDKEKTYNYALWIAKRIFDKADLDMFQKLYEQSKFKVEKNKNQIYLTFEQELYCNMTLIVESLDELSVSIEIGYYIC